MTRHRYPRLTSAFILILFAVVSLSDWSPGHACFADIIKDSIGDSRACYVWAPSGLNLREKPSPGSRIIVKLPYGADVVRIPETAKPVAYRMEYYKTQSTNGAGSTLSSKRMPVWIDGYWVKVSANGKIGYAFSALLLGVKPKDRTVDIADYLIDVFRMNKIAEKQTAGVCEGRKTRTTDRSYASKITGVTLRTTHTEGEHPCWIRKGEVEIAGFAFDQALVFITVLLSPFPHFGYEYQAGKRFEYSHDGAGNSAALKKTKDGVSIEWVVAPN